MKQRRNMGIRLIFIFLACHSSAAAAAAVDDDARRRVGLVEMIPQQSCYYTGYNRRLTCHCNSTDTAAFVDLKMKYYVFDSGNEIGSVLLQGCRELLVNLDLHLVDATNVPVHFHAIRKVRMEKIQFEPSHSDTQELQLEFNNVEQLFFEDIFVEDTLKLKASNVKEAHFVRSTFAHIPRRGFDISRAKTLNIRDSKFLRVSSQSIVVEKTKEVTVVNNEMAMNALEVVFAKDGSHLMISCNRLFGQPASPECSRTTTTITTTTTAEPPSVPGKKGNLREDDADESDTAAAAGFAPELAAGVAAGVVVVAALLFLIVCFLRKKRSKEEEKSGDPENLTDTALPLTAAAAAEEAETAALDNKEAEPKESDALLNPEDDDDKPKFASPIWLEEIQKNKIFNRQKSLLSEEGLKDLAEGVKESTKVTSDEAPRPKKAPAPPPPVKAKRQQEEVLVAEEALAAAEEEETRESSRTESDEDAHKHPIGEVDEAIITTSPEVEGTASEGELEVKEKMQTTDEPTGGDVFL